MMRKDEDEGAEDDEDVEDAAEGAEEAAAGKTKYSDEFKSLVLGLRRRSFTQGGIDAVVDLHTARALCQDFISSHLTATQHDCEKKFNDLFLELQDVKAEEEEEDDEDED